MTSGMSNKGSGVHGRDVHIIHRSWRAVLLKFKWWYRWRFCRRTGRVVLIRHAEPLTGGSDPSLSPAGIVRATELVHVLEEANVAKIVVSELQRSQQTAADLATHLGITPVIVTALDIAAIVDEITTAAGLVLVIGHTNTVPDVIAQLGAGTISPIAHDDFDNMFIVQHGAVLHLQTAVL